MIEDLDVPKLTDAAKARWHAALSDVTEMSVQLRAGTATPEVVEGALNRLIAHGIDRYTLRNALHIPADAGPYALALEQILRRIPDGFGRWISHDAGWYPIVTMLDGRLAEIDPLYVVHQVKEKFGTLRYYCAPSEPTTAQWDAFSSLVGAAERISAHTCERCGGPGLLRHSRHSVKTVCSICAESLGYLPKSSDSPA